MAFLLIFTSLQAQKEPKLEQVWDVQIVGNENYKEIILKDQIANTRPRGLKRLKTRFRNENQFDETEVKKDVIRLERFYERRGFPNAKVQYRVDTGKEYWQKLVTFQVFEGRELLLDRVEVVVNPENEELLADPVFQKILSKIWYKPERRWESIRQPETRESITEYLQNNGYPYSTAEIRDSFDSLKRRVDLSIIVTPGPKARIDSLIVTGEESVSKSLIRRESELEVGAFYSKKDILTAQREIYMHHLFQFATIVIEDATEDSTVTLAINVREHPLRAVEIKGGIGNEDLLRTQLTWTHRNVGGWAHRYSVSGKASFIEQRLGMNYVVPYVFNNRSSSNLSPFAYQLNERAFSLQTIGVNTGLVYQFLPNLATSISYEYTNNNESIRNRVDQTARAENFYDLSTILLSGFYEAGFFENKTGWIIQPTYQLSGIAKSATFSFQKATLEVRKYQPIGRTTELAGRIQSGLIFGVKQDSLPSNVRLYLGGTNSVRGFSRQGLGPQFPQFDENGDFARFAPLGGQAMLGFNLEVRQQMNAMIKGFGMAFFFDGGHVSLSPEAFDWNSFQYAAGMGFRYRSPIGPLRLDVGYKLNPTDQDLGIFGNEQISPRLGRFAIHLSIGQAF